MIRSFSSLFLSIASLQALAYAQDVPIVQPGAPGASVKTLSAAEAVDIADTSYSPDDAKFMQNMIPHHFQAVQMANLVEERTNNKDIIALAGRIKRSQADEIAFMQRWLNERGLNAPDPMASDGSMAPHMGHKMMGMASKADMKRLAQSQATAFDRLFLQLMIPHHEGAVRMVTKLWDQPGSAFDPILYEFTSDIVTDQRAEILVMNTLATKLSEDPRAGLAAGFKDAGVAAKNVKLVASLPKPKGFFDPENPADLPPVKSEKQDKGGETKTEYGDRSPLLSFWNTDMAFAGDKLVTGSYHGFNVYQLSEQGVPQLFSSIVCPGGQGDVSIVGDLLIMSVEDTRGRIDCGLQGVAEDISDERFRGLRIFDISDLSAPRQVGLVQTCRGSHTHSVVSANNKRIVVYNSGILPTRDDKELAGCIEGLPGDSRTALFSIDVIEIPLADPSKARITSSPRVFAEDGRIAGLWQGGDHGDGTQETRRTDQCHDITVFPEAKIAAGACSGNGIILDISNPLKPRRIDAVTDDAFAYWHSATFNNDGTKVLFTDEWGGGSSPRCRASDPLTWGANAIFDIDDGKLTFQSYSKIGAPQTDKENCVAHNGSIVPVPGRDIFVQAWYQGGMSVLDFTDSANPQEIAFFDRGPIDEDSLVVGGYWSTYWYEGKIYGTEMVRGLDVLELQPSAHLSEAELAAAAMANMGEVFNPQQQFKVTWPDHPIIAMAYRDQLVRDGAMDESAASTLTNLLDRVSAVMSSDGNDRDLSRELVGLAKSYRKTDGSQSRKMATLADTLAGMASEIR